MKPKLKLGIFRLFSFRGALLTCRACIRESGVMWKRIGLRKMFQALLQRTEHPTLSWTRLDAAWSCLQQGIVSRAGPYPFRVFWLLDANLFRKLDANHSWTKFNVLHFVTELVIWLLALQQRDIFGRPAPAGHLFRCILEAISWELKFGKPPISFRFLLPISGLYKLMLL